MELKPSLICFSQNSISNYFHKKSNHSRKSIGETLDDLCEGKCRISDIPRITVVNEAGLWITADNRRLWVFQELERLGKCDTIPVIKGYSIPRDKRTSNNGGKSIKVRRNPGGRWYLKPSVPVQSAVQPVSSNCWPRPNGPGLGLQQSALPMGSSYSPIPPIHTNTRDNQEDPSLPVSTRTGWDETFDSSLGTPLEPVNKKRIGSMGASEDGPEKKKARYDKADHSVNCWPRPNRPGLGRQQSALPMGSSFTPIQPTHSNTRDRQAVSENARIVNDHVPSPANLSFDKVSSVRPFRTHVARYSYGVRVFKNFIPGVDPEERKVCIGDITLCKGFFHVVIQKGQQLEIGQIYRGNIASYSRMPPISSLSIYRSDQTNPRFVDDGSCELRGHIELDLREIEHVKNKLGVVDMAYDGEDIVVTVRILKTGKIFRKNLH